MSNRLDLEVEDLDLDEENEERNDLTEEETAQDEDDYEAIRREWRGRKGRSEEEEQPKKKGWFSELMSWVVPFAIALAIVFVLKNYVIINANIPSGSMENTIMTGDNLIGFRLAYLKKDPQRGDIIIFNAPDEPGEKYIKRVIGLPGETVTIEDSTVYIDGVALEEDYLKEEWTVMNTGLEYTVPEGCYFVMGDNRNHSEDARFWTNTYVERDEILGKAEFVYWPIKTFRMLE